MDWSLVHCIPLLHITMDSFWSSGQTSQSEPAQTWKQATYAQTGLYLPSFPDHHFLPGSSAFPRNAVAGWLYTLTMLITRCKLEIWQAHMELKNFETMLFRGSFKRFSLREQNLICSWRAGARNANSQEGTNCDADRALVQPMDHQLFTTLFSILQVRVAP